MTLPKILWIGTMTECEPDILHDAEQAGLDLEVWNVDLRYWEPQRPNGRTRVVPGGAKLLELVRKASFDLAVFRYPYYLDPNVPVPAWLNTRPVVAWASEQGPTCLDAVRVSQGFRHVAANNQRDALLFRKLLPKAYVHVLPFGCTDRGAHVEVGGEVDLIADGKCHYACKKCGGNLKRQSVRALILPLLEDKRSLALYGPQEGEHGWDEVPGAYTRYRGVYPVDRYADVYARHKAYVGISWNWQSGGYGVKLARALSSGIPVLWHRTPGMTDDGLVPGKHLLTSSSAEETRTRVAELLADDDRRLALGEEGRRFALERWRWAPNLVRLLEEVRHPSR